VSISEDSVADIPVVDWEIPEALAKRHCYSIMNNWLHYARRNMQLKFMVADLV